MKPLIKQFDAAYVPAEWDGINRSGVRVVGKTVLVLMDTASGKSAGEHGGQVELTDDYVEKMTAQAISGVLVAISEGAFCVNEDGSAWSGEKPRPGDRVNIAKYSGTQIPGRDGKIYRLMDYGCIGGVYTPEAEYLAFIAAEEKRLGIEHLVERTVVAANTAIALIDGRCRQLGIVQKDGPACAIFETTDGKRHIYTSHSTTGIEQISAERGLASSAIAALEPDKVLVWRVRPEVDGTADVGSAWFAYCRFALIEPGQEIVEESPPKDAGTGLALATGTHAWDPEDMKCRACGTKLVDVTENGAPAECPALAPQQTHGAAVAA